MKVKTILMFLLSSFLFINDIQPVEAVNVEKSIIVKEENEETLTISNEENYTDYIGYGYNVAGGKAICETDAILLNNPILDINSEAIINNTKVFNIGNTKYVNNTSSSVREISESFGQVLTGGLGATAKIAAVNVDINARFDTTKFEGWGTTQGEEYSYFSIFAETKPVVLQLTIDEIRNNLSVNFKNDIYSIKDEATAKNVLTKYGTHLLTGYTLGGIFEMTNYYAFNISTYNRQNETSFSAQVEAGMSNMASGNGDFSFSSKYGQVDNGKEAVNKYKCSTYGGKVFPGLTIDQAFSLLPSLSETKYTYQIWTDSINEGENLVIVSIPQSSQMVPLWNLLPLNQYNEIKDYLLNAYVDLCGGTYKVYKDNYKDVYATDLISKNGLEKDEAFISLKGLNIYSNVNDTSEYMSSYIEEGSTYRVMPNSIISFDYEGINLEGNEITWSVNDAAKSYVSILDSRNGVFRIKENCITPLDITIQANLSGSVVCNKKITVTNTAFLGSGTTANPYLIYNANDFVKLSQDSKLWSKSFKLVNDIECDSSVLINNIGNETTSFSGSFDGNYYTIKLKDENNFTQSTKKYSGLFGKIGATGEVKNLKITSEENNSSTEKLNFVNYDSEKITKNNYLYSAIICGYNLGTISNCSINNINIDMEFDETSESTRFVGGVVGNNRGVVSNCKISNSTINVKSIDDRQLKVGGIIGYNESTTNDVAGCEVDSIKIIADIGSNNTNAHEAYVGGLIGHSLSGKISECKVNNIRSNKNEEVTAISRGNKNNSGYLKVFAGGLVGALDGGSVSSCLILNVDNIHGRRIYSGNEIFEKHEDCLYGILIGYSAVTTITNCFIEIYNPNNHSGKFNSVEEFMKYTSCFYVINRFAFDIVTCTNVSKISSNSNYKSIAIIKTKFESKNDFSDLIKDSNYWSIASNEATYPELFFVDVRDDINFDFSGTKKTFYIGEQFKTGNIIVSAYLTNGEEYSITPYSVDYSAFDSSKEGTYPINITAYDHTESYNVQVVSAKEKYLTISTAPSEKQFANDEFISTGMVAELTMEDGTLINLREASKDENGNYIADDGFKVTSSKLVRGSNKIVVTYKGLTIDYYVNAVEKVAKDITIVNKPNQLEYDVGTTSINATGMQVKIDFEEGNSEILGENDYEVISSAIKPGANTVKVNYEYEFIEEFTVTGVYLNIDYTPINDFIALVNTFTSNDTMEVRFNNIRQGYNLLNQIRDDYYEESFDTAKEVFNNYITQYNNLVNGINNDYMICININDYTCNTFIEDIPLDELINSKVKKGVAIYE